MSWAVVKVKNTMNKVKELTYRESSVGEAAVDGLVSGILAGAGMALYLVVVGIVVGDGPGSVLSRFDPGSGFSPLNGALAHVAVSGVYGMVYGLVWQPLARSRLGTGVLGRWLPWLAGLAYGFALLLVAEAMTLRLPGASSPLRDIPFQHLLLAHLIYSLVLSLLVRRRDRSYPLPDDRQVC
jgi:hypothetical protein